MSFILDALKKADAERHVGELPSLRSPPAGPVATARRAHGWRRLGAAGGAVLLAACALVLLVWKQDRHGTTAPAQTAAVAATTAPTVAPPGPRTSFSSAETIVSADAGGKTDSASSADKGDRAAPAVPASAVSASTPAGAGNATKPAGATHETSLTDATGRLAATQPSAPPGVSTDIPVPPPLPVPVRSVSTVKPAPVAQPANLLTLAQLPPSVRAELPTLVIGGSMYSKNPADRMLLLDKRMLHEGDEIAPGLLLESIQPKTAILRYKGSAFRLAL